MKNETKKDRNEMLKRIRHELESKPLKTTFQELTTPSLESWNGLAPLLEKIKRLPNMRLH